MFHQSFSRIYSFLTSQLVLERINACYIGTINMSDHAPVRLSIAPPYRCPIFKSWHLNASLFIQPRIFAIFEEPMDFFNEINC